MTEVGDARRRRRRRRRLAVGVTAGVVVLAASGSAWAMSGTDAPSYRLATATKADVEQTVDVDGTLAARDTTTAAFASGGTVESVRVAVGDTVRAGQTLATIDPAALAAAVDTARAMLAEAKQRLADDQEAQLNGTASTATTTGGTTGSGTTASGTSGSGTTGGGTSGAVSANAVSTVTLTAARTTAPIPGGTTSGDTTAVSTAQQAVIDAQRALDKAVAAQDSAVADLISSCAATSETRPATSTVTAGGDGTDGTVSGSAGSAAVAVTLRTTDGELAQTTAANPQRPAAGATWTFTGLAAGTAYRVETVRTAAIDSTACGTAVSAVGSGQQTVDAALTRLDSALAELTKAVEKLGTSGTGGGTGTGGGSVSGGTSGGSASGSGTSGSSGRGSTGGSAGSGASAPSGSTGAKASAGASAPSTGSTSGTNGAGTSTGTTVTAEQIAADTKNVDAEAADLAVAEQDVGHAVLTSSIAGTVAAVSIAKGDTVSASSTTSTITVVGTGTLSSVVDVGIADIDLVEVGEKVAVSVDGHTTPVAAHVTYIGTTNSASSTGSAATFPVTVALDRTDSALYDGMGASLAIDVGGATGVLTVPVSAVHTTGTTSTVSVYESGSTTTTRVTLGLVGDDRAQIRSGLDAGDRVVLAEVSAAVPSTTTDDRTSGGLGGLTGSGQTRGGPGGGAPPAGR